MKLFLVGLASIGLICLASLFHDKLTTNAQGITIAAVLLGVNAVMLWGVVRKHR